MVVFLLSCHIIIYEETTKSGPDFSGGAYTMTRKTSPRLIHSIRSIERGIVYIHVYIYIYQEAAGVQKTANADDRLFHVCFPLLHVCTMSPSPLLNPKEPRYWKGR